MKWWNEANMKEVGPALEDRETCTQLKYKVPAKCSISEAQPIYRFLEGNLFILFRALRRHHEAGGI